MQEHDGRCVITAGRVVLFEYAVGDAVMRNIALAALRQLGFKGRVVAAVLGLTENYVATLHNAALRDGSAALVMQDRRGTPGKVTGEQWEQARAWRAQGASDAEIGRRLQVAHTTIGRALGPREMWKAPPFPDCGNCVFYAATCNARNSLRTSCGGRYPFAE
jgi:transposase